ncbi:sonic hedgehog protein-like [Montipora capricornis]|uniref:sonic hedgehog protein-like n=1 Tax=Montipora capricornis TaxID=246305 RepID=UPI0035F19CDF
MPHRQSTQLVRFWSARPCIQSRCNVALLLVISSCGLIMACGPGTTGTGERQNAPMRLKQSIPNLEETSISASGKYTGKVRRGSEAYEALELNYNPDIVFKDDKHGDTRRMTKNCNDKINTLAARVKEKWGREGVKLRVITAYDIDDLNIRRHDKPSLHHEGRAVDLTTSDRDKDKYPELGRMAHDAGFNWVLYASKGYIHASVKSDEDASEKLGCFPGTASVRLEGGGTKTMKDLRIGDKVASMDPTGKIVYSKVITFLDIKHNTSLEYITIQTKNPAAKVAITASHLIYQLSKQSLRETALFARDLKVGDFVYVRKGPRLEKFTAGRVAGVTRSQGKGAYAPLTEAGNIEVDNVLCSCYAVISDVQVAHWSFAPLRFAEWLFPGVASHHTSGMHWYANLLYNLYTNWNYASEKALYGL